MHIDSIDLERRRQGYEAEEERSRAEATRAQQLTTHLQQAQQELEAGLAREAQQQEAAAEARAKVAALESRLETAARAASERQRALERALDTERATVQQARHAAERAKQAIVEMEAKQTFKGDQVAGSGHTFAKEKFTSKAAFDVANGRRDKGYGGKAGSAPAPKKKAFGLF